MLREMRRHRGGMQWVLILERIRSGSREGVTDPVTDSPGSRQEANRRILGCTAVLGWDVPPHSHRLS